MDVARLALEPNLDSVYDPEIRQRNLREVNYTEIRNCILCNNDVGLPQRFACILQRQLIEQRKKARCVCWKSVQNDVIFEAYPSESTWLPIHHIPLLRPLFVLIDQLEIQSCEHNWVIPIFELTRQKSLTFKGEQNTSVVV